MSFRQKEINFIICFVHPDIDNHYHYGLKKLNFLAA